MCDVESSDFLFNYSFLFRALRRDEAGHQDRNCYSEQNQSQVYLL